MANKTVDRKRAVPARSQAAKASPKNVSAKTTRPSETPRARASDLKAEKPALEMDEIEREEVVVEEEEEVDEEEVEVVEGDEEEEEEEVVEERARARRSFARRERDLMEISPEDYSISRPAGSRLPNFPGSQFLYSSYRELRLVTWPSRHDTWNWSVVVMGVCVAVAVLLGLADLGLAKFVTWWLSLAH